MTEQWELNNWQENQADFNRVLQLMQKPDNGWCGGPWPERKGKTHPEKRDVHLAQLPPARPLLSHNAALDSKVTMVESKKAHLAQNEGVGNKRLMH